MSHGGASFAAWAGGWGAVDLPGGRRMIERGVSHVSYGATAGAYQAI